MDSNTKSMGFDEKNKDEVSQTKATTKTPPNEEEHNVDEPKSGGISRKMSQSSLYATDQEEEDDDESHERKIELGPQYTLKEQLEKDKVCLFSFLFLVIVTVRFLLYLCPFLFSVFWGLRM